MKPPHHIPIKLAGLMKNKIFIIFLFVVIQKVYCANNETAPFFIAPQKWQVVNPKHYPPYVKISFVKKEISVCRPTLNLAMQKTSLTLDEYAREAQKIHVKGRDATYKILQKIPLSQGPAVICKIDKKTNDADFEMLQMLFVKEDFAYVITGGCKKSEMLNYYRTFMDVFLSFQPMDDLFSLVSDKEKKEQLTLKFNDLRASLKDLNEKQSKKKLALFEKYLDKKFANLGKYFQILLIKKVRETKDF